MMHSVESFKAEGNAQFQKGKLEDAIETYTLALEALEEGATGLGTCGKDDDVSRLLQVTILSNRAACYLKQQPKLTSINAGLVWMKLCIQDCTDALEVLKKVTTSSAPPSSVREKLLFRRAKARFTSCALRQNNGQNDSGDDEKTMLSDSAKDLLQLLSDNPHNKDAQKLLQTIRAKHSHLKDLGQSSILGKLLHEVKHAWESGDELSMNKSATPMQNAETYATTLNQHTSKLLAFLSSDECTPTQDWMELGRRGGIPLLWKIVQNTKQSPASAQSDVLAKNEDSAPPTIFQKVPLVALHILSCVTSLPQVAQKYATNADLPQHKVSQLMIESCRDTVSSSLAVASISLLLRLVVALDTNIELELERGAGDKNVNESIAKNDTLLNHDAVCAACIAALQCTFSSLPAKAALDLLTAWASPDREMVAQALLESSSHGNIPVTKSSSKHKKLTKMEEHKLKPREFAAYRKQLYQLLKYQTSRAKQHSVQFLTQRPPSMTVEGYEGGATAARGSYTVTGMEALLQCAARSDDVRHVREISVVLGRLLSHIQSGAPYDEEDAPQTKSNKSDKKEAETKKDEYQTLKALVGKFLKIDATGAEDETPRMGPIIEELDDEEASAYEDEKEDDKKVFNLEKKIKCGLLVVSLLVANLSEVGVWAMEQQWGGGSAGSGLTTLESLASSASLSNLRAQRVASEWIASCTSSEKGRSLITPLLQRNDGLVVQALMESDDADVRSGAASALAKLGMASASKLDDGDEEGELMSMLQLAVDLLQPETYMNEGNTSSASTQTSAKDEGSSTTVERGIEILSFLCSRTKVKEEVAHGFACSAPGLNSTSNSKVPKQTVVDRLVELASLDGAAETRYAYGVASIFANICVSVETLRKQAFEDKDISMEDYDQLQSLGKTDEEKKAIQQHESDPDAAVLDRIRKLASSNVPRALVKLLQNKSGISGNQTSECNAAAKSSDATQEQLTLAMCRMATEPSARGTMIQQGCLSACVKLDKDAELSTEVQKQVVQHVRHTVAKMLVTTNPGILTSAQRLNAVKPLMALISDADSKDLQRFEALLSITNIASCGDEERDRVVSLKGISTLNYAMFSDHEMVRQAATEAMSNLFPHDALMKHMEDPEHIKLWVAFASDFEENVECARAAAGCLAMATQAPRIAKSLVQVAKFKETVKMMLECGQLEMMHRCMVMILNLIELGGDIREAVVEETNAVTFCQGYLDTFHNQTAQDMGMSKESDQQALAATLDMAKAIVRAGT